MKINKKIIAAVLAAALLSGGAVMLTKDDISQKIKEKELIPYTPAPIILAELDDAVPEVPTKDIPAETEYVKPENIQDFPDITPETPISAAPSENVQNELRESVKNIQAVYTDVVGWLYIPDTSVNYPVMQGEDNDFYLHHSCDGSRLLSGSVFLDFRCESRFMNNLNVLYGHNMNNGSMFADVCKFKEYGYFQAHKYGWLATADDVYRIDFFSAAVTDCDDEIYSGFENTADRISHIYDISQIYEPTEISEQDRLVLLSTCSYEFENARTVLTGKLVRMEDGI
ncbi:MAG: class B sortase [Ruminococcus flavefaciens]|nr:class B sortase [Ruminococcus flavefaciens]